jgi:hypothetical protein
MIVRLLVVVLTLIGAVPIRICTCGAAHNHVPADVHPAPCSHNHEPQDRALDVSNAPGHEHHDADCHAVKPRPLMSVGLSCASIDVPPADALAVALVEGVDLDPAPGHTVRDVDPPPRRALFLTYTVLRN